MGETAQRKKERKKEIERERENKRDRQTKGHREREREREIKRHKITAKKNKIQLEDLGRRHPLAPPGLVTHATSCMGSTREHTISLYHMHTTNEQTNAPCTNKMYQGERNRGRSCMLRPTLPN